ncbi:hypothetical protein [Desulfosporosinus sp. BICA1-9]|uniref:hypothetical protein n=1 Tax=Desulfosporosinus sp. BICA1-9 TaxID=1531958 RepID=UPI00054C16D2|nr:hypothetical protein [Desulfosporosinus sp. BICA1-9]KJS46671.1 MAG: membrane protein [Peptococcaceae bacterium BRH_c23]KJS79592.1 MAG: membrane protein [Desulfosporosinus sp. BICA1-9]HBW36244.1 hypothetical protein [Desulfosporosinus sp.]
MSLLGPVRKRKVGQVQPYIPFGPFQLRLPIYHYRFEIPDFIQGLLMCAVCLGAIPLLQEYLGMPFEVALTIVILNGFFYLLHSHLGDPIVPGWITPAIPLLLIYLKTFPEGVPRMHALIAFELELGLFAFFLGATGLAKKFVDIVPDALKSGILLGAGIAAIKLVFDKGQRFDTYPWTITIAIGLAFYLLFSNHFKKLREDHKPLKFISDLGLVPALLLAIIIAPLLGELPWPNVQWGFTVPQFYTLFTEWTPFSARIGWPALSLFVSSAPLVISVYIVLFGDLIQAEALIDEAREFRNGDENVHFDPNRNNIIVGIRNMSMSMLGPDLTMCGPIWAAMQVVTCERYKQGPEAMDSLTGGVASFRLGTFTGYFLTPIVTLVKPILPIALALTMLVQGYVSVRVGVLKARTFNDLGIAGIVAAVLISRGAGYALAVGTVLCVLIFGRDFFRNWPNYDKKKDPVFNSRIEAEEVPEFKSRIEVEEVTQFKNI